MRFVILSLIALSCSMCQSKEKVTPKESGSKFRTEEPKAKVFDIQGHRGCRGLMPENTLPAFQKALELGVTTLELDLAVSADSQLVVSHEPYFRAGLAKDPSGNPITKEDQLNHNIFRMTYDEVKKYDVGTIKDPNHPNREDIKTYKPLLSQVVRKAQQYAYQFEKAIPQFNIEIKRMPEYDNIYHPSGEAFVDLVLAETKKLYIWDEAIIQSFDLEVLRIIKDKNPRLKLALLIENDKTPEQNISELGFKPNVYSCYYKLLKKEDVDYLHQLGIDVIPWTVNENEDISHMISIGVDGIISDYPDRVIALTKK